MKKSKLIFTAGLGTLFEHFDFYLFSLFAVSLNYSFFASINKNVVLWVFIVFAVGYFARIMGALVFGYWGDKIGRLYSFKKTILIMAISSIIIGIIPSYESIGIFAVIFLMILRFIQGVSYGGEMSGATIVIVENIKKRQSLSIMLISIMGTIGVLLAQLLYSVLEHFLSSHIFFEYGWRIAYIVGGILILHSYQARKKIAESEEFRFFKKSGEYKNTILLVFQKYKYLLILSIGSILGVELYWGTFVIYFPNYIKIHLENNDIGAMVNIVLLMGLFLGQVIGGVLANFIRVRVVFTFFTSCSILITIPTYLTISYLPESNINIFYFCVLFFSACQGGAGVLFLLMLAKRIPVKVRYTIVALAYALSAFFFIGLPPFIFSYFTREASMYYPMLVLGIGYIVQLIAVQFFYNKTKQFVSA